MRTRGTQEAYEEKQRKKFFFLCEPYMRQGLFYLAPRMRHEQT